MALLWSIDRQKHRSRSEAAFGDRASSTALSLIDFAFVILLVCVDAIPPELFLFQHKHIPAFHKRDLVWSEIEMNIWTGWNAY